MAKHDHILDIMGVTRMPSKEEITESIKRCQELLAGTTWYTLMSYGDIIITKGRPYQVSPLDENNPSIYIVRQWCDNGDEAKQYANALNTLEDMLFQEKLK